MDRMNLSNQLVPAIEVSGIVLDSAALDRVEKLFLAMARWQPLRAACLAHQSLDPSAGVSLRLHRACLALGLQAEAREALQMALSQIDDDASARDLADLAKCLSDAGLNAEVVRVQAVRMRLEPEKSIHRVRWLDALARTDDRAGWPQAFDASAALWLDHPEALRPLIVGLLKRRQGWALVHVRCWQLLHGVGGSRIAVSLVEAIDMADGAGPSASSDAALRAPAAGFDSALDMLSHTPDKLQALARTLARSRRWGELIHLRAAQMQACGPGAADIADASRRSMVAAFGRLDPASTCAAMLEPVLKRLASLPLALVSLAQLMHRRKDWRSLSMVRCVQLESPTTNFDLAVQHLRSLRQSADAADVDAFLADLSSRPEVVRRHGARLVRVLERERQFEALQSLLVIDTQVRPNDPGTWLALGTARALLGNPDAANEAFAVARRCLLAHANVAARESQEWVAEPQALGSSSLPLRWIRKDGQSWLGRNLGESAIDVSPNRLAPLVEALAGTTQRMGASEIWSGYSATDIKGPSRVRAPNEIRVPPRQGELLAWLAQHRRPELIVEIGSGFGVSGCYWSSGLEEANHGRLLTFEPNPAWQRIVAQNISRVSSRFTSVLGTVEETFEAAMRDRPAIDILFIDGIHTPEAVKGQLDLARPWLAPGALVMVDDLHFSDRMYAYWTRLATGTHIRTSVEVAARFGLIEFL